MFLFYGIFFFLMKKFASVVETDIRKKDKKEVERKEKELEKEKEAAKPKNPELDALVELKEQNTNQVKGILKNTIDLNSDVQK